MHRRTRRGGAGNGQFNYPYGGGRKKMMRTHRRTHEGGAGGRLEIDGGWRDGGGRKKMMRTRRRTKRGGRGVGIRLRPGVGGG